MEELKARYFEFAKGLKEKYGLWNSVAIMQRLLNDWIWKVSGKMPKPVDVQIALIAEVGELVNELGSEWKWWSNGGSVDREAVLEELVDVLHFYMSLVVFSYTVDELKEWNEYAWGMYMSDYTVKYDWKKSLMYFVNEVSLMGGFSDVSDSYLEDVIRGLGFTDEEIWQKYVEKSFENYVRQVGDGRYGKVSIDELRRFADEYWRV